MTNRESFAYHSPVITGTERVSAHLEHGGIVGFRETIDGNGGFIRRLSL
jgi:hypothetical protein